MIVSFNVSRSIFSQDQIHRVIQGEKNENKKRVTYMNLDNGSTDSITQSWRLWSNGALMAGREFCYRGLYIFKNLKIIFL